MKKLGATLPLLALLLAGCGQSASGSPSKDAIRGKGFTAVPDAVTRLVIDVDAPFDDFRSRYEAAVPTFSPDKLAGLTTWDAVKTRTAEIAPNGFLLYGKVDAGAVMKIAGHTTRSVEYLMGNHTVAETMFGKDPGVMLYAPLRTLLYEDLGGKTHFAVDQPSTRFSSFGNADIAATGKRLDHKLALLLATLGLPVPDTLAGGA